MQLLAVICLTVAGAAGDPGAADLDAQFKALFGDEIRRAAKTLDPRDDAKLAGAFLHAAALLEDRRGLKILLYEKAAEFGSKDAEGYAMALKALDLLARNAPDKAGGCETMRLAIFRARFVAARGTDRAAAAEKFLDQLIIVGDVRTREGKHAEALALYRQAATVAKVYGDTLKAEIAKKIKSAGNQVAIEQRRKTLKAKLNKDPSNMSVREQLVMLELLDFDSPARAMKLLKDDMDESLRTYVSLAAGPVAENNEAACLELGEWYRELLKRSVRTTARTTAIVRAFVYYHHFLSVHKARDVKRIAAQLALNSLKEQADKAGITLPGQDSGWIDLLKPIVPAKHGILGRWTRQGGQLTCSCEKRGLIGIPVTVWGSYDLRLSFTVRRGHESAVILPVGAGYVSLTLGGWAGKYSGLCDVDRRDPSQGNPTTVRSKDRQGPLRLGVKAAVEVNVRVIGDRARITASLNGRKIVAWSGKQSSLRLYRGWTMRSKTFGLGSYGATVVWHSVRLKRLDPTDSKT